jgi:Iron-containing redox enzyme
MLDLSHSRMLRGKIRMVSPRLDAVALALWNHSRFAEIYRAYLFHNHAVVRASVPLMQAALDRITAGPSGDPVSAGLAEYLAHHIPEEMHHDDWLLEDLEVLGVARGEVMRWMPPASVATMVGAQYYWIRHFHPVAVLGYIAVLEGTPPVTEDIEAVAARTGLPREAFSTMLRHARLDPYHRDDLDRALDALPLTPDHSALLGVSAFHTVHWLGRIVEEAITVAGDSTSQPQQ